MLHKGLSAHEAEAALKKYGPNELKDYKKRSLISLVLSQLKSPLILILIIASAISVFIGQASDALFIIAVVVINSSLGFFQEYRAENTLYALRKTISKTVRVIRDSKRFLISVEKLVPGDIIILEAGLNIPADCTILEASELSISEALLTGESHPIKKKESDRAFKGTLVLSGYAVAKVTATGENTEFGKIAKSVVESMDPNTPTKKRLILTGRILTIAIVAVSVLIFLLGLAKGMELNKILLTSVALGVSTVPEGLLIAYTVTLALGMNRLLEKKSVVKNLQSAETLGSVDVLCIDKTGTLTLGEMKVSGSDLIDEELAITALALCNSGSNYIDKAVADFITLLKGENFIDEIQDKRTELFPFNSSDKYTGAYDGKYLYAVGAPEKILTFSKKHGKDWHKEIRTQSLIGNRVIALAYKESKRTPKRKDFHDMNFLGLIYISDPIRESAADSLHEIQKAGVDIKIITGDLIETSLSALDKIGFNVKETEAVSGFELQKVSDSSVFDKIVLNAKLFYRTTPGQKLSIVKSLQKRGKKVGMMGDGVNDSPALKNAEIGIAVDTATDVSKEAADIVLLDSNLQTIVDSVEEGRNIFKNLRKIFIFIFSDSLTETVLILSTLLMGLPLPLTALQLLWINIIEDGLPSLALSFERTDKRELLAEHNIKKASVFDSKVIATILIISLITDFIFLFFFKFLIETGYDLTKAQTLTFAGISLTSLFFLFSVKTVDSHIFTKNLFDNKWLNLSVLVGIGLLILSIYWSPLNNILGTAPLNTSEVGLISAMAIAETLLIEVVKFISRLRRSVRV